MERAPSFSALLEVRQQTSSMPKPKAKRKKKEQGSISSDCSETYSTSNISFTDKSVIPTWSQMPPLSLDDIVPPTPSTNTSNEVPVRDHLVVDDLDVGDTFEGFHSIMEDHISVSASLKTNAQLGSQPHVLQSNPKNPNLNTNTKIVIIEPIADPDGPNARPLSKFFSNEISLSTALANSLFGKAGIGHISRNPKRQLLVVSMKDESPIDLTQLLGVTKLGSWNIKCRLPVNQTVSVGVIGPLGEDVSDEELTSVLVDSGYKDVTAERILKGKGKLKTSKFKINFPSSTLPNHLYFGYQRFKVDPFVADPWQCYRCQYFGHSAISCKGPPRCVACGGAHSVKDCSNTGRPHCCNCGGPHTANYGGCPRMKEAKQVEKAHSLLKLSYRDALKSVRATAPAPQNPVQRPASSMASIVSPAPGNPSLESRPAGTRPCPITSTVGTQTTDMQRKPTLQNVPVDQFIELLIKLLSLCKPNENTDFLNVATRLIKETFHIEQPSSIQLEHCSPQSSSTEPYRGLDEIPLTELTQIIDDDEMSEMVAEPSLVLGAPPRPRMTVKYRKATVANPASQDGDGKHRPKGKTLPSSMTRNVLNMPSSKCPTKKK